MSYREYRNVKIPNIFSGFAGKWFAGKIAETKINSNTK